MHTPHFPLSPIALAALLLAGAGAHAQPPVDAEALPTVIISASADASAQGLPRAYAGGQVARGGRLGLLGNVDMMDTPFNTTNYTQALIQDQQARSVADVLQNDPSVRVARGFGNYQELYVIRGFAVNSDDLAYNGLYGLLPRQFVASELLERVEVLRGASSFLNGAAPGGGGVGGAINLLPKRAANTPLTQLTVGVDGAGQAYAAVDVGRRFGPGNSSGLRVNAVRRSGDTPVAREGRDLSVLAFGFDHRGRNLRVSADIGYQDHQLEAPRPSVTVGAGLDVLAAPGARSNWAQRWTRSSERDTFATLRGEVDLAKDAVAWAALGARSGDEANILAAPTITRANGDAFMVRFDNARFDKVRTGEVGVRASFATGQVKHTVSATLSDFAQKSRNAYAMSDFFSGFATNLYRPVDVAAPAADFYTGGSLANPLLTHKSILSSYALADTLSFAAGKLRVTVGARHQRIKDFGYDYTSGAENARYDQSALTPVLGVVVKPAPGVSLYANYIEALQQGPVAAGTNIDNAGATFAPFTSRQKEIGVKYDAGKLGMSAALFATAQPSAYIVNRHFGVFGEQRNRGLELSAFGSPLRGVRVLGGLTLLDAEQRVTAGAVNQGNDAIGVPRTQFNVGAEWDPAGVPGLTLNARTVYTSSQFADGANLQKLPSWGRLDLGASYATRFADRAVTLRARIDNATGKDHWASAGGYPGAGYLVLGAPRSVVLSASIDL
ncbi:TonB-dependent receptor [Massilia psychrophila]|uniref:TonB-dependent siderophore receptor n=1 Tax=Massilia psychrophila TaxID=1603353 RepID=A0A2G8T0W6_9BURK|nr:TonB-dependent receptor [Massilia psychrophila]PIL39622.1 TonB-dependent siderophore receptor [Massilia psychrophila]GGE74438.1 TonB-dependent receptor [Massilia psychrophila]